MRRYFFEVLSILLIAGSLVFFAQCISYLTNRDYVSSLILLAIGMSVMTVGKELARLALVQRE
jgi:uncharacterized membrane protein YqgA involved in biofilm formation